MFLKRIVQTGKMCDIMTLNLPDRRCNKRCIGKLFVKNLIGTRDTCGKESDL